MDDQDDRETGYNTVLHTVVLIDRHRLADLVECCGLQYMMT